jgi:serine/threonine protein kinase
VRNMLIKSDFTVKVADFGLSRRPYYGDEEYISMRNGALPVRYTAPETLDSGRFTIYSECWSFGVVLWELFMLAKQEPYSIELQNSGTTNQFFIEKLLNYLSLGHRLAIPDNVPENMSVLFLFFFTRIFRQKFGGWESHGQMFFRYYVANTFFPNRSWGMAPSAVPEMFSRRK